MFEKSNLSYKKINSNLINVFNSKKKKPYTHTHTHKFNLSYHTKVKYNKIYYLEFKIVLKFYEIFLIFSYLKNKYLLICKKYLNLRAFKCKPFLFSIYSNFMLF